MALEHKKTNLSDWIENMRLMTMHSDDIALYLLCSMYNKLAYVHTSRYGWSTLPFKVDTPFSEITVKCDVELILLHCWSFGEVLKICQPLIPTSIPKPRTSGDKPPTNQDMSDNSSTSSSSNTDGVMPENVSSMPGTSNLTTCTVNIE